MIFNSGSVIKKEYSSSYWFSFIFKIIIRHFTTIFFFLFRYKTVKTVLRGRRIPHLRYGLRLQNPKKFPIVF